MSNKSKNWIIGVLVTLLICFGSGSFYIYKKMGFYRLIAVRAIELYSYTQEELSECENKNKQLSLDAFVCAKPVENTSINK